MHRRPKRIGKRKINPGQCICMKNHRQLCWTRGAKLPRFTGKKC